MIEKLTRDPDVYDALTRYDTGYNRHYDYETGSKKMLTSPVRTNVNAGWFGANVHKLHALTIDSVVVVRNFFNITVDKYYNSHST